MPSAHTTSITKPISLFVNVRHCSTMPYGWKIWFTKGCVAVISTWHSHRLKLPANRLCHAA